MNIVSKGRQGIPLGEKPELARPLLFDSGRIGPVELKNRLVLPPMTTRCADRDGFVTDDVVAYYVRRATGGVGLVTVEMSAPEPAGRHRHYELGIHDDKFLPGLTRLVDAIHKAGAAASIQLGHGGGHTRRDISGEAPIAPSAIPHTVQEGHTEVIIPEEMSEARIEQTVAAFGEAAFRAQRAGFDVVEIHGAHGYLISQFLAPAENRRRDRFGGSFENRARFAIEVTRRVRAKAPDLGVVFRLNGEDYFPNGVHIEEARQLARWVQDAGADAIHVTGGHYRSLPSAAVMIPPMAMPDATFLHLAAAVKENVMVPVIAAGRFGYPAQAMAALADGKADFIALGRPLLADPDWPARVLGKKPVRLCIACNTCVDTMRAGEKLRCLVNPEAGRELAALEHPDTPQGLKIAVLGAGPAGLTYASLAGGANQVTVFERTGQVGGAFLLAGEAPKFQGVDANPVSLRRYVNSVEALCRQAEVAFRFNFDLDRDRAALKGFDLVVLATGATYRWKTGVPVEWLLRRRLLHLPILCTLASSSRFRDWFYYKARRSAAESIRKKLDVDVPVIVIGDARKPGKSQEAILSAYEAATGRTESDHQK